MSENDNRRYELRILDVSDEVAVEVIRLLAQMAPEATVGVRKKMPPLDRERLLSKTFVRAVPVSLLKDKLGDVVKGYGYKTVDSEKRQVGRALHILAQVRSISDQPGTITPEVGNIFLHATTPQEVREKLGEHYGIKDNSRPLNLGDHTLELLQRGLAATAEFL